MDPHAFTAYRALLADLAPSCRRRVVELIRLAAAIEPIAYMRYHDAADALWCVIRSRDDGWTGRDAIMWARRAFTHAYLPPDGTRPCWADPPPDDADPWPGCYYVSACPSGRQPEDGAYIVAGPYSTHRDALDRVQHVRRQACRLDRRGFYLDWGTARSAEPQPTLMGVV